MDTSQFPVHGNGSLTGRDERVRLYMAAVGRRVEWIYGVTQPWRTTNEGVQASSVRVG